MCIRDRDIPAIYEMLRKGCETARATAAATLDDVRKAKMCIRDRKKLII